MELFLLWKRTNIFNPFTYQLGTHRLLLRSKCFIRLRHASLLAHATCFQKIKIEDATNILCTKHPHNKTFKLNFYAHFSSRSTTYKLFVLFDKFSSALISAHKLRVVWATCDHSFTAPDTGLFHLTISYAYWILQATYVSCKSRLCRGMLFTHFLRFIVLLRYLLMWSEINGSYWFQFRAKVIILHPIAYVKLA